MIVAIDPGIKECAYAVFSVDDMLVSVGFEPPKNVPDLVVVERPEYHGARSNTARTQDLLALSWQGAASAYRFGAPVSEYGAGEWNGGAPKPVTHLRLWRALSDSERALLGGLETYAKIELAVDKGAAKRWATGGKGGHWYPKSFKTHNLLDAVAIGCVYLGRL